MRSALKKIIVRVLTWEARAIIRRHKPSVVGVTGSVGKTSTKDAIYAVLRERAHVRKSEKSFNSEIGVPLTILGRPNAWNNFFGWFQNIFDGALVALFNVSYPDWLVLEIGADRPGDIRSVARWLPVDVAVITRLPEVPVHVEYFESPEELLEEKASLISALRPSGTLVLSADDARVAALAARAGGAKVLTFGYAEGATVRAEQPELVFDDTRQAHGMHARIEAGDERADMMLRGAVGSHVFLPALAAVAVAKSLDMKLEDAVAAIERKYLPPPGRMHLISGMHESLIIDDTYNSSPAAAEAALHTLSSLKGKGRKIAVLGDMMELGKFSVDEHRKLGALAAKCADVLITVGIRTRDCAVAALDAGMPERVILQAEDAEEAGATLAKMLEPHDVVLIKGSQSMRLEKVVAITMAEPARAKELLVRQESEWRRR
jgi:UDP-N-acetylmuramyl pentapeptide synthase